MPCYGLPIGLSSGPLKLKHTPDPTHCFRQTCNTNSASADLSKWLRLRLTNYAVVPSLHNSTQDEPGSVECPSESIDQMGVWS